MKPTFLYISLSYEFYQYDRIMQIAMLQDSGRSQVIAFHSREIGKILLILLYYYHMEYMWMTIGDRAEWYFGSRLSQAFERGSYCILFCLCRLRTVCCIGFQSGHRLIILSTYLLMGAGRLITLLSWVPALSRLTDWRRGWWRSKHHTESETQV